MIGGDVRLIAALPLAAGSRANVDGGHDGLRRQRLHGTRQGRDVDKQKAQHGQESHAEDVDVIRVLASRGSDRDPAMPHQLPQATQRRTVRAQ